jgi:cytochrome c oxidase cbb3-type subunit 3
LRAFASLAAAAFAALGLLPGQALASEPAPVDEQELKRLAADPRAMEEAQKKYTQTCAACHGPKGAGLLGPNLTDDFYIHGGSPGAIAGAIAQGNPKKGMPAMASILGPEGVKLLTAYVMSMKGQNLPGKPPEGKEEK